MAEVAASQPVAGSGAEADELPLAHTFSNRREKAARRKRMLSTGNIPAIALAPTAVAAAAAAHQLPHTAAAARASSPHSAVMPGTAIPESGGTRVGGSASHRAGNAESADEGRLATPDGARRVASALAAAADDDGFNGLAHICCPGNNKVTAAPCRRWWRDRRVVAVAIVLLCIAALGRRRRRQWRLWPR